MASTVEICNRALQKLGAERITSITEDSVNARACNNAYEAVKVAELEDHYWVFSIKRAQLAADVAAPAFGRGYSYTLPADYLKLAPLDPEWVDPDSDWQVEGKKLLTNDAAPLNIRYVYDVTDPNEMTPLFRESFATRLALELCEEITQSNSKKEALDRDYEKIVRRAKKSNGILQVAQQPPEDPFVYKRL